MFKDMKYFRILSLPVLILLFTSFNMPRESKFHVKTVVIDAGHGGKDPGTSSNGIKEKDVVLKIALETGRIIQENLSDVKVIYTRTTDKFVKLHDRAEIANKNNADVFISIHCNAVNSSQAKGTETWVMGLHKSKDNLSSAMKENSVILMEEDYEETYSGFDPNSPEAYIIFSLYQNAFLESSLNFAEKIEDQFKNRVQRKSRGVKQAGFLVLWKTAMPSVLIETGFLTNYEERTFLTSENGQVYLASAIYRAFRDYKNEIESNAN
jgi:N-acetylmuramoyl-L-alanine amidase